MTVTPAVAFTNTGDQSASHACCELKKDSPVSDESPSNSSNNCCEDGCNPFVNCCGMMGFIISDVVQLHQRTLQWSFQKIDFYQNPISDFNIDIWHPPQV